MGLSLTRRLELMHELHFELAAAQDIDELCRRTVEQGHRHVGLDRIGVWFLDPDNPGQFLGSFGVDEQGEIRDERNARVHRDWTMYDEQFSFREISYRRLKESPIFDDKHNVVGHGELIVTPIWDGTDSLGVLTADNLTSSRPASDDDCQLLVLLARMLGHLVTIKRTEQQLREETQKLEELNRELESKSLALERSLAENQELNRNLEKRVAEHAERLERASTLKRYLPPDIVDEIIEGGRDLSPRTERRKITVMFSDVHGFTTATDGLEPEELARLLNGYLSAMSEIAFAAGATIDKFRGDGMMVFFGAPKPMDAKDGANACLSMAIDMCRKVEELRQQWFDEGYDWDLGIRVGINTGYGTVGEFGSPDRLDYTAIGTEVNVAARLEAACDTDTILISHATWALVRDAFPCEPVGQIELKGINRKVRAYTVEWRNGQDRNAQEAT